MALMGNSPPRTPLWAESEEVVLKGFLLDRNFVPLNFTASQILPALTFTPEKTTKSQIEDAIFTRTDINCKFFAFSGFLPKKNTKNSRPWLVFTFCDLRARNFHIVNLACFRRSFNRLGPIPSLKVFLSFFIFLPNKVKRGIFFVKKGIKVQIFHFLLTCFLTLHLKKSFNAFDTLETNVSLFQCQLVRKEIFDHHTQLFLG